MANWLIVSLTVLLNYWIWRILAADLLLAVVLLLLTVSLYRLLLNRNSMLWTTILLFAFASVLAVNSGLDRNLWALSYTEEIKLNQRHFHYAADLGGIYQNKLSVYIYNNIAPFSHQLESNIFSTLDLNLYFFASHPRERSGIEEFNKYPSLFLPFFIIGSLFLGAKRPKIILGYLGIASLVSGFISPSYRLGPVLFLPLINSIIAFGVTVALAKVTNIFKSKINES